MTEMTHSSKRHRQAMFVGRRDDFLVAHAATGLDHGARTGLSKHIDSIAERKKRIRRDYRPCERQASICSLYCRDTRRIDATHLARADAQCPSVPAVDDGV